MDLERTAFGYGGDPAKLRLFQCPPLAINDCSDSGGCQRLPIPYCRHRTAGAVGVVSQHGQSAHAVLRFLESVRQNGWYGSAVAASVEVVATVIGGGHICRRRQWRNDKIVIAPAMK